MAAIPRPEACGGRPGRSIDLRVRALARAKTHGEPIAAVRGGHHDAATLRAYLHDQLAIFKLGSAFLSSRPFATSACCALCPGGHRYRYRICTLRTSLRRNAPMTWHRDGGTRTAGKCASTFKQRFLNTIAFPFMLSSYVRVCPSHGVRGAMGCAAAVILG